MKGMLNGQASKFLVALGSAAMTALSTYYSGAHWMPMASAIIGAALVWLVPNKPA